MEPAPQGEAPRMRYTWPGEGEGDVVRILTDLAQRGYRGGISIEPHIAVVHHDATSTSDDEVRFRNYVEYGKRLMTLLDRIGFVR
jgi:sugar phosphate isomerase/epimerase